MTNYRSKIRKFIFLFTALTIFIVTPYLAYADIIAKTAKYAINTVKFISGGAKVEATSLATGAKHTIKHGVSASALGQGIGAGIVQLAVTSGAGIAFEAITGLALDAVDWVMDPENNAVKYREKNNSSSRGGCPDYASTGKTFLKGLKLRKDIEISRSSGDGGKTYTVACKYTSDNWFSDYYIYTELGNGWKKLSYDSIAQKELELAQAGNTAAQNDIVNITKDKAQKGELDDVLDKSPEEKNENDKQCPAGYYKVSDGSCKKKQRDEPEKTCPPDQIKIGDKCIKKPDGDDGNNSKCECCEELLSALAAMAEMNAKFYKSSFENDEQMISKMEKINDNLIKADEKLKQLVEQSKQTKQSIDDLAKQQKLDFKELKEKIDSLKDTLHKDNEKIIKQLDEIDDELEKQTQKLNAIDEKLQKIEEELEEVNENLKKMQLCNVTEFNKKVCDFFDWIQKERVQDNEDNKITPLETTINWQTLAQKAYLTLPANCPANPTFSTFIGVISFPVDFMCRGLQMFSPILMIWASARAISIIGSTNI